MKSPAKLNHIGIAVASLPDLTRLFSLLGLNINHVELVEEQGVKTHFFPLPREQACIELLEATDPSGTVAKFIQKKGPGVHHLSFELAQGDLDPLCAELLASGYRLIYDSARSGAHGMRVNFIHPASTGGVLIEIMELAT